MMLLRILRHGFCTPASNGSNQLFGQKILSNGRRLSSVVKQLKEFEYLDDYLNAILKECRTNAKPMPWKSLTPNLIDTLPASKQNNRTMNLMQIDSFVITCLALEKEYKAILDYIVYKQCEIFLIY